MSIQEPPLSEGRSALVDRVIEMIQKDLRKGDTQALDELLRFCPRINLIRYLDEEEWDQFIDESTTAEERNELFGR